MNINVAKICNGNILVKRNHKIESQCKRTSKRESDILEAGPSPRGEKEGRPSPPPSSHPRVFVCQKYLEDYTEAWNSVSSSKIAPHRWQRMCILGFQVPCWRTMLITITIITAIIILVAIIILIINIMSISSSLDRKDKSRRLRSSTILVQVTVVNSGKCRFHALLTNCS